MGLADDIKAAGESLGIQRAGKCHVKKIMDLLDEVDRVAVDNTLNDVRVVGTNFTQFLREEGKGFARDAAAVKDPEEKQRLQGLADLCSNLSVSSVQRHRRGACLCPRRNHE